MVWDQFHVERPVQEDLLRDVLGEVLGVAASSVQVADEATPWRDDAPIRVELRTGPGEFPQTVDVLFEPGFDAKVDRNAVAKRLAERAQVSVLRPFDEEGASALLVHIDGRVERVQLDFDALESGAFVLAPEQPKGRTKKKARARRPGRDSRENELSQLMAFLPDAAPVLRKSEAEKKAYRRLSTAVKASAAAPSPEALRGLQAALREAEATFTAEQRAELGSTLHTLVRIAELLLKRE